MGPAKSLVHEFKYQDHPLLAKGLAAFLFLQFNELKWPLPDLVTYVPQSRLRWLERGYNQSKLLAQELAIYLDRPSAELLKKNENTLSQASQKKEARNQMDLYAFSLKSKAVIEDKIILLIDDVYTTGTTLDRCAYALQEGLPKRIYALTFCYTSKN